jgi:hypothetical protein
METIEKSRPGKLLDCGRITGYPEVETGQSASNRS